ncbi:MAG: helix-turn-helix transcriptional regulator [Bacteroidaceae bacterium]|nr:helix-turn-helix transcriptional regulator [Bacteroidaceae bacterium]
MSREFISSFQFTSIVVMLLLTMTLAFTLFRRVRLQSVLNRSRWLMATGTTALFLQFMLQYTLRLRDMGDTQALILNLLLFVPSSWLIGLSVMYMQRQGKVKPLEWAAGGIAWAAVAAALITATVGQGDTFFCDTPAVRKAENICALIYLAMQSYYTTLEIIELKRLRTTLAYYYDHDMSDRLRWMKISIWWLTGAAMLVPVAIMISGKLLFLFGIFALTGVWYLVISFRDYIISRHAYQVMEAQQSAGNSNYEQTEEEPEMNEEDKAHIQQAVDRWTESGGYLRSGITMSMVAAEMHIPQAMLRNWFHTSGYDSYPEWMQLLRIKHAKKLMTEHSNWSLETIAEQSGFSTRNYFQTIFKKHEGMTPAQYMSSNLEKKK